MIGMDLKEKKRVAALIKNGNGFQQLILRILGMILYQAVWDDHPVLRLRGHQERTDMARVLMGEDKEV